MDFRDWVAVTVVFLLAGLGILGNFFLLSHQLFLSFHGCRPRATALIVKNLIMVNLLVLCSSSISYPLTSAGWYQGSDLSCKFLPYVVGVGRGVSISTTCLLSVVQAITIGAWGSRWAGLREKAPRYVMPCIALCWVLSLLLNSIIAVFMASNLSDKNDTGRKRYGQCSTVRHDPASDFLYGALLSFPDVVFFVTMVGASASLVYTLSRHRRRVWHLHGFASSTSSPESRATHTILLLVSTFVCCNIISSMLKIAVAVTYNPEWFLFNFNKVIELCFPTLCPFLLLSREPKVSMLPSALISNSKCHKPSRNM
ncbi:vomeronasal type-1 receptor 4-like [Talpa occidentalis]|uniref:vomeronasal type-1 receptor 4-like n=1 Tax=Talpa occidentalis TaxID=50954 RepID=UPI0023F7581B|nr:vomeronasal type-1 receptor 4-like [Talpa occidentalis]